ncbi:chromatin structure-remodeling complex protein SYD-like [Hevea brasiliensis]|uniref:chromatin structure-remodeling complex protein SYD-like n=1 Tax=Hevea brasiliensis TaxID=3981 RepID=UPI0025F22E4B|nr:chromatin structure-remodeling complex protein SYD-like [Hevea brasiliensis]
MIDIYDTIINFFTHLSRDPKKEVASTKLSELVAVPPTVIETPLTTKPLKKTKEPIQTTTATSDQEVIKSSPPPSMTAETMILPKTKEPIQTTAPTSDQELIKSSSPPPSIATETKILPKTKEPIQTTAPTSDQELIKSSSPPPSIAAETKILPKVLSHLAELKESIPVAATIAKTAQAHRTSLSGKTTDLEARLAQREKKLSFLETEFSRLSKEEEKVEAQFQFLITQKEKILANKKYVLADLEKTNDEALKDLEEWRNLESEIKQVN